MFENYNISDNEMDWINEINPSEVEIWLYKNFNDLKPIIKGNKIFYVDEENKPRFYIRQDENNKHCWFKYFGFWGVLMDGFGLGYMEIQEILNRWLRDTYNLRGFIPQKQKTIRDFNVIYDD